MLCEESAELKEMNAFAEDTDVFVVANYQVGDEDVRPRV